MILFGFYMILCVFYLVLYGFYMILYDFNPYLLIINPPKSFCTVIPLTAFEPIFPPGSILHRNSRWAKEFANNSLRDLRLHGGPEAQVGVVQNGLGGVLVHPPDWGEGGGLLLATQGCHRIVRMSRFFEF